MAEAMGEVKAAEMVEEVKAAEMVEEVMEVAKAAEMVEEVMEVVKASAPSIIVGREGESGCKTFSTSPRRKSAPQAA